jgi:hypothetical protein
MNLGIIYFIGYDLTEKEVRTILNVCKVLAFIALVENNDGIITVFSPDSKILYRSTSSQKKSMDFLMMSMKSYRMRTIIIQII